VTSNAKATGRKEGILGDRAIVVQAARASALVNFVPPAFVDGISMFRRGPRQDFADFIDWMDYQWDAGPLRNTWAPNVWGHNRRRRGRGLASVLLAVLVIWVVYRVLRRRGPLAW